MRRPGTTDHRRACAVLLIGAALALAAAPPSLAQEAAPKQDDLLPAQPAPAPPPVQAAPVPSAPAPAQSPGFFEAVGRWFDEGTSNFREHLRGAKRRMDDLGEEAAANTKGLSDQAEEARKNAAEATKSAVDAVAKLPTSRVMQGRERCVTAPNGAPDCVAAADALCRKHGYSSGKSVDFTSAEECSAKALLGQVARDQTQCTTVTFISRAMCQ